MQTVRIETTVLPGNRVEITSPDFPVGEKVEVVVLVPEARPSDRTTMLQLVATLPPGPRACATWEEYERILEEEKNSWE